MYSRPFHQHLFEQNRKTADSGRTLTIMSKLYYDIPLEEQYNGPNGEYKEAKINIPHFQQIKEWLPKEWDKCSIKTAGCTNVKWIWRKLRPPRNSKWQRLGNLVLDESKMQS